MDCLPVDKFTINPAQIKAANYTLEGCRGATMGKSSQPSDSHAQSQPQQGMEKQGENDDISKKLSAYISYGYKFGDGIVTSGGLPKDPYTDLEGIHEIMGGMGYKLINDESTRLDIFGGAGVTVYDMADSKSYRTVNASADTNDEDALLVWRPHVGVSVSKLLGGNLRAGGSVSIGYGIISGGDSISVKGRGKFEDEDKSELNHLFIQPQLEFMYGHVVFFAGVEAVYGAAEGESNIGMPIGLNTTDDGWDIGTYSLGGKLFFDLF